jgi:hypothetical protein
LELFIKNILYKERDEEKRRVFTKFFNSKQVKDFVFVDESGMNHQDIKEDAWSDKGVKVIGERSGAVRHRRTIVIAGMCRRKIMASFYFDDYTKTDNFCIWLEKVLCPKLRPKQMVIMDNASFYISHRIREIIEHVDCQFLYLPPDSPDLNFIEHDSAWFKNKLSYLWHHTIDFYD